MNVFFYIVLFPIKLAAVAFEAVCVLKGCPTESSKVFIKEAFHGVIQVRPLRGNPLLIRN
jgi:hypothetical protein